MIGYPYKFAIVEDDVSHDIVALVEGVDDFIAIEFKTKVGIADIEEVLQIAKVCECKYNEYIRIDE